MQSQTTTHSLIHTYSQFRNTSSPNMHVFGLWVEVRAKGDRANSTSGSNQEHCCYKATQLSLIFKKKENTQIYDVASVLTCGIRGTSIEGEFSWRGSSPHHWHCIVLRTNFIRCWSAKWYKHYYINAKSFLVFPIWCNNFFMLHIKRYGNIGDQSCIVSESLRMHSWIIIKFTLFTCLSLYEGRYFLIIIMEKTFLTFLWNTASFTSENRSITWLHV